MLYADELNLCSSFRLPPHSELIHPDRKSYYKIHSERRAITPDEKPKDRGKRKSPVFFFSFQKYFKLKRIYLLGARHATISAWSEERKKK